jgi:hypothetical protein
MKLTSVEIHPDGSSNVLLLSFRDPSGLNPYNVKDIKGLDADEIIPQYIGSPGGSPSFHLVQGKRVIVLRMGLNPNFSSAQTFSDLRDDVYKMIASSRKGKVQLQFKDNNAAVAGISGYISKFESEKFVSQQEIQLTVMCDTAMLTGLDPVKVDVTNLNTVNTFISDDLSTAPHGFTFDITFESNTDSVMLRDPNDLWFFEIAPSYHFENSDTFHFSNEGEKSLYRLSWYDNSITQLADAVTPGSTWPMIYPGDNHFKFMQPFLVWKAISYYPTYWGV